MLGEVLKVETQSKKTEGGNYKGCNHRDCRHYPDRSVGYSSDEVIYWPGCRMCYIFRPFDFYQPRGDVKCTEPK